MQKLISTLFTISTLFVFSCSSTNNTDEQSENSTSIAQDSVSNEEITETNTPKLNGYENSLEGFSKFCEKFKENVYADNLDWINKINKSGKKMEDLGLTFFKDTVGLDSRTPKVNEEMGGFEYACYYASEEKDDEGYPLYESGIYYYFSYNETEQTFDLKEVLMAG